MEIPEWLRGHRLGELLEKVTAREAEKRDVTVESLIEALDAVAGGGELPQAPEEAPAPRPLAESGERRHLTVMFCDLVNSAGLTQRLGTEAYRQVVQAYQARGAEAIERYGGHVAQYLGDGLLVYFGYPQAHEDDAERAVRADAVCRRGPRRRSRRAATPLDDATGRARWPGPRRCSRYSSAQGRAPPDGAGCGGGSRYPMWTRSHPSWRRRRRSS